MDKSKCMVLKNDKFGRYLAASRDLKQGETIFTETPAIIGPPLIGNLICFDCGKPIEESFVFCTSCKIAIKCSSDCTGEHHNRSECSALTTAGIPGKCLAANPRLIYPLRFMLLKKSNPDLWKTLVELESHIEARRDTPIWKNHQVSIIDTLKSVGFINEEFTEELVQKICGIIDVNSFEIRPPKSNFNLTDPHQQCPRGLYINAALMAHDCTSNTFLSVNDDFVLTVKASTNIAKNSPIFFNYSNVLHGTLDRKRHLKEGKYFDCCCERCSDPSELGTDISSLKCHKCNGTVRSTAPNRPGSDWECSECKKQFKRSLIDIVINEGRRLIEEIDRNDVNKLVKVLDKLSATFHPNHFVLLETEQNLIGLYSLLPSNETNLTNKIDLCRKQLQILDVIEPGLSRIKGMIMYQMQFAMVQLANETHKKTPEKLLIKLRDAEKCLMESLKHLLHEPLKSPEGKVAQMAMKELKSLRSFIENLHNDLVTKQLAETRVKNRKVKK
ncbi:unnamed protein product [Phyllotreta striolata]|uniref:SET domain-containing protein n=1 Tax=Phyllotreta striolata TaxID=444603 RepID=A0A9N9XM44_PHYSR|nr:unnamed protein product [Phyllotreta striolata]